MHRFFLFLTGLLMTVSAAGATPIQQLEQLVAEQQFSAAAKNGEQLLALDPAHLRARFLTAYAYQMSKRTDAAIKLYQDLIRDHPELPEPRNNLAMIYIDQEDYDSASQMLVAALNTHPSYATAYQNLSQVYRGIASEAYRRAVSESAEPAKYAHNIELTAITRLESVAPETQPEPQTETVAAAQTLVNFANQETLLIEQVKAWAKAWSNKDFAAYTGFYSSRHRAKFKTHEQWLNYRRERILRPGEINVGVTDIQIKWRSENRAIIDFNQAFDSPRYSDRVVKRLDFSRIGSQWKITGERVLSVL